ncbi:hypothetical protein SSIL_1393 [Solibacillus silvestris StLB046]|uniref:Uncharacterized protein n=1 Tax=Solibacillus silvestris (strain StLB046) TaxID=1002809 RepID=F2F2H8_SOLSS|nr:hypothetical protein [Solibacillus silvestris]BAK15816.1 hypothetical protein SSIL_1393 [Solibacillus silvestris StLB046]
MSVRQHEEERQQREQFLKKENEILNRHKGELIEQKWILEMENKRLREALEFYVDKANYSYSDISSPEILADNGRKARKALEGDSK